MKEELVEAIFDIAYSGDPDELLEMTIASRNPKLYDQVTEVFGSWDAVLAQAVCDALLKKRAPKPRLVTSTEEEVERVAKPEAKQRLYARTTDGAFFWIPGDEFEITSKPRSFSPPTGHGPIERIWFIGEPDGIFVYSTRGCYYGLIEAIVPQWAEDSPIRPLREIAPAMFDGEEIRCVTTRRAGNRGRYIHITKNGKGKASEASEMGGALDRSGREAFLLNKGDEPVAVLGGDDNSTVFCASAFGQGIHFESADMRSMGRKAVGVNVMKLGGPEDEIVNAFFGDNVKQAAVITASGMGKRIWFEEFRTQGRGGSGMQVLKLEKDDVVAAVVPTEPDDDLIILTNQGRAHRLEATKFDLMGRPAKGNRVIDLRPDEKVIGLASAPCSTTN